MATRLRVHYLRPSSDSFNRPRTRSRNTISTAQGSTLTRHYQNSTWSLARPMTITCRVTIRFNILQCLEVYKTFKRICNATEATMSSVNLFLLSVYMQRSKLVPHHHLPGVYILHEHHGDGKFKTSPYIHNQHGSVIHNDYISLEPIHTKRAVMFNKQHYDREHLKTWISTQRKGGIKKPFIPHSMRPFTQEELSQLHTYQRRKRSPSPPGHPLGMGTGFNPLPVRPKNGRRVSTR